MRLPDFLRTSTFRLAASFAVLFALSVIFLFAFIYWQTALQETARIDRFLVNDASLIARQPEPDRRRAVALRSFGDLHRISYAALFDAEGLPLVGNLPVLPAELPIDGQAHELVRPTGADILDTGTARAVGRRLPDGTILVVGRNVDALRTLAEIVLRALELGVIPALVLAIAAGAFVSWRAQRRVKAVHQTAERILFGALSERLPVRGTDDDFDRLARGVNRMLDEIGRLLTSVKAAGNDIAQDLRAPLARVRAQLERGKETARTAAELRDIVAAATADLDRAIAAITTLLRIADIEAGRHTGGGARFDLAQLVDEVGQIYQPLAEEAGIDFAVTAESAIAVSADRGLMLEAIANLTQNAIKFTPAGGRVRLEVVPTIHGPAVRVTDNGPGIPVEARRRVFERFYRLDLGKDGSGLGLSLVAAIAKFHGFRVDIDDAAPGSVFTILCRTEPALTAS